MKKNIKFIFISLLLMFSIPFVVVNAEWNGGTGNGGTLSGTCDQGDSCWNDQYQGLRLTLVDSSMSIIPGTHSLDIWNQGIPNKTYTTHDMSYKTIAINTVLSDFTQGNYNSSNADVMSDVPRTMGETKVGFSTVQTWIEKNFLTPDANGYNTKLYALGVKLGITEPNLAKYFADGKYVYLMVEPITGFTSKDTYRSYAGTGTELGHIIYDLDLYWIKSLVYKGHMPLSLYINKEWKDEAGNLLKIHQTDGTFGTLTSPNATYRDAFLSTNSSYIFGYGLALYRTNEYVQSGCTTAGYAWKTATECCYLGNNMTTAELSGFYSVHPACKPSVTGGGDLCNFDLDPIDVPNNCDTSNKGKISDIEDWSCIFKSRTSTNPDIANHYYEWSNAYCSVFCREDVTYTLPTSGTVVLAGQRFTVGASGHFPAVAPVTFKATTQCRTTSNTGKIDYTKFKADYDAANTAMRVAWDNYKIAILTNSAYGSRKLDSTSEVCCSGCCGTCPSPQTTPATTCCGSSKSTAYHYSYPSTYTYTKYDGTVVNISVGSCTASCGSSCATSSNTSAALAAYNSAVAARDQLLVLLNNCNNYQYTNKNFIPDVYFKYEEAIYGGTNYKLAGGTPAFTSSTNYFKNSSSSGSMLWDSSGYGSTSNDFLYTNTMLGSLGLAAKYNCSGSTACNSYSNINYQINDTVTQTTTKTYNYTLPTGVYTYIGKPSGQSYNTSAQALVGDSTYYTLPYSNLPIHYSRVNGAYDFELNYTSFGSNHKFNKFIFGNAKIGESYGTDIGIYSYLWNNPSLNSLINHCGQSGNHLSHSFVSAMGSRLNEFLVSGCATLHNCKSDGSKVTCNVYQDAGGNSYYASSNALSSTSYTVYSQLRQCIQGKVVNGTGSVAFNGGTKYECTYNVQNDFIKDCDTGGDCTDLTVTYRTISTDNPFPGMTGLGRTPGSNWNDANTISAKITNIRGVNQTKLYIDRDPLYKITLTPALIKQIRAYNKEQEVKSDTYYDSTGGSVTGSSGYSDFEMTCDLNGVKCKSKFIRGQVSTYKFSDYFSGCAISGKTIGLTKCANGEAW